MQAGQLHSLFLDPSGCVWACGGNKHGQLGNGSTQECSSAQRVLAGDHRATQVS